MSVRVVARIRPLLEKELERDVIVRGESADAGKLLTVVKIPNPKNETEEFSFAFNGVYDQESTQEDLFTAEVAPHLKSLFHGVDLTIFAYGVTGTGKTHTMRGGLRLADRGVIPRLLSGVFRRSKRIVKDSSGATSVSVALSYYEIYNDKVFDLLEPPDKRTPAGLPLREKDSKTFVVGLSERACGDLKDFEKLYIEANNNRQTAATKLNAHSSRSHAILRVKLTQTTAEGMVRESTASAIDLAGSEDNRRTDNGRERLVESAAINKSLFVLSQCIDAISRGDKRIPYRESKMTRILSLGQNNGITVMILNLAPIRSYHLDTLSSLNVSSRAKRIEAREIENEVVFKQVPRAASTTLSNNGRNAGMARQPLRPLANAASTHNATVGAKAKAAAAAAAATAAATVADTCKPVKAFSVYTDMEKAKPSAPSRPTANTSQTRQPGPLKRISDSGNPSRLAKPVRPVLASTSHPPASMSAAQIEAMVERKVSEILASRAAVASPASAASESVSPPISAQGPISEKDDIGEAVQRRLDALERRIDGEDRKSGETRSEGLRLLLSAKRAKERGDGRGALRMYEAALPYFPKEARLTAKIEKLRARLEGGQQQGREKKCEGKRDEKRDEDAWADDDDDDEDDDDASFVDGPPAPKARRGKAKIQARVRTQSSAQIADSADTVPGLPSPRTQRLLDIVNSRDTTRIRLLNGFGAKKAQDLVEHLNLKRDDVETGPWRVMTMAELRTVPGMGGRTLERAYENLAVEAS